MPAPAIQTAGFLMAPSKTCLTLVAGLAWCIMEACRASLSPTVRPFMAAMSLGMKKKLKLTITAITPSIRNSLP